MKTLYLIGKTKVSSLLGACLLALSSVACAGDDSHEPVDWCVYSAALGVEIHNAMKEDGVTLEQTLVDAEHLYQQLLIAEAIAESNILILGGWQVVMPGPITYTQQMELERIARTVFRHPNRTPREVFRNLYGFCECPGGYCAID